ncbi:MAG: fibronectin type III domain-containing protein, partial [Gemmatimonadetes bacterium]|nr:fibronectin type III domain-containing protein [Gemmatimonadota bacterium]
MRTGAIFARGSCRALKWLALVGVVFALGTGSAIAQPSAPTNFEVMPTAMKADGNELTAANTADAGAVLLKWREPSGDDRTVKGYQWSSNGGRDWLPDWTLPSTTDANNANLRAAEIEALSVGSYVFALRAVHDVDGDGNAGESAGANQPEEISDAVTVTLRVIGVPPNPAFSAGFPKPHTDRRGERVMLQWTATATQAQPIESYEYRFGIATDATGLESTDWSRWMETAATSATVPDLANGSRYVFGVRAVNKAGVSLTPIVDAATPATTPSEPQNLVAAPSAGIDGQVVLTWDPPSRPGGSALTGYEYRVNDDTDWKSPANALDETVTLPDLTPRRLHTFYVRAVNIIGPGEPAMATATPTGEVQPPTAPQDLTVTVGNEMVTLAWMAPMNDGGASVTDYEYEMDDDDNWMSVGWSPGMALRKDVTDLRNGQSYAFRVRAVNSAGKGEPSTSMSGIPAAQVPTAPRNLTAAAGNMMVTLTWIEPESDGGDSIIRYEYNVDSSGTWTSTGQEKTATVTMANGQPLVNGRTYTFGVRAVNDAGNGAIETVEKAPVGIPVPDVTVKSVTSATSVAEAAGLTVTVTMNVPAGTKGADDKIAPIASKMVYVTFSTEDASILARDAAEADDTTLLGTTSAGMYTWTNIPRKETASEVTRTFRVAIGQDLDAEDEKFKIGVQINDPAPKLSKVVTIDDAEEQKFVLSLDSSEKAKNTIKEGGSGTLKLEADPDKTVELPVSLVLSPDDPDKYTLSSTSGTLAARGSVTSTVSAKADGDRAEDTVTVMAYTPGTLGNDVKLAELEITVTDINALPDIGAMFVDDKGVALDPQPESKMEGETVKVMLTVVDKDGKAIEAAEKLTVSLTPSSGSSQDYRLSTHPIVIDKGKKSSASVDLTLEKDDDLGMEMLVFDASVAGDSKIGTGTRPVSSLLSLTVEDGTMKYVKAKSEDDVYAVFNAAKADGMGEDGLNPRETVEFDASMMFTVSGGASVAYSATSDNATVASVLADGGSGMTTITANAAGPQAHITVTATATPPSGVQILDQTTPYVAQIVLPVDVVLAPLTVMVAADPMEVMEGGTSTITATANRPVTEATMIALSVIGDEDAYEVSESIAIAANASSGTALLAASQDDDYMDETLTLVATGPGIDGSQQLVVSVMDDDEAPVDTPTVSAKSQEQIDAVFTTAIVTAAGGPDWIEGGSPASIDMRMLFDVTEGASPTYSGSSGDSMIVEASSSGTMLTLTPMADGMATITVTASDSASGDIGTASSMVTVADQPLSVTVVASAESVEEGGSVTITATANKMIEGANVEVMLMRDAASSASMEDYSLSVPMITIMVGDMDGSLMLTATDDVEIEGMESLTLVASVVGGGDAGSVMLSIADNDMLSTYTLSGPDDSNLVEGMSYELTVTADPAVQVETTVMIMRDGTSSAGDADFEVGEVTIEAGSATGTTMLMAVEDSMAEDMEMLVLYGMEGNQRTENSLTFNIWDAAVPVLP